MTPDRVILYVDRVVIEQIQQGLSWDDILKTLKDKIINYKKRNYYIEASEDFLVNNWNNIEWKKRMTAMLVIQTYRRLCDIKWIKENRNKFITIDSIAMYKLIELKDKLRYNQSSESVESISNS